MGNKLQLPAASPQIRLTPRVSVLEAASPVVGASSLSYTMYNVSQSYGSITVNVPAVLSLSNQILSNTTWLSSSNWALQGAYSTVEARVSAVTASMTTYSKAFTTSLNPWLFAVEATYTPNAYYAVSSQISSLESRVMTATTAVGNMTTLVDATNGVSKMSSLYDTTAAVSSALYALTNMYNTLSDSLDSRTKQLEYAFSMPRMVVANVSTGTLWSYGLSNTPVTSQRGLFVQSTLNNAIIFSNGVGAVTFFVNNYLNYTVSVGDSVTVINYSTSAVAIVNTWEFGTLATNTSQYPAILQDAANAAKTLVKTVTFAASEKIKFIFTGDRWVFLRNQ